jgi:hypothetical protein
MGLFLGSITTWLGIGLKFAFRLDGKNIPYLLLRAETLSSMVQPGSLVQYHSAGDDRSQLCPAQCVVVQPFALLLLQPEVLGVPLRFLP